MRIAVTDTHALVFFAAGSKKLSRSARTYFEAAESSEATIYVPSIVLWEMSLLMRGQKIDLGRSIRKFAGDLFSNPSFQFVGLSEEHLYIADEQRSNADPFDALICAVAIDLRLPLITRDGDIESSGLVEVIW